MLHTKSFKIQRKLLSIYYAYMQCDAAVAFNSMHHHHWAL
jgi:hypothetical protein